MEENCTHDCSTCGANCSSRDQGSLLAAPNPLSHIRKVIGIVSGKGGVGKSMVTSMLATLSCRKGLKTAILDADITGPSIPRAFGIHEKAEGTDAGILPVRTKFGIDIMSINLLLETETTPVVWRGPVIAGAVSQFWTDVIWGDKDIMFIDMPPGTGDVPLTVFQSLPVDGIIVVTSPQELVSMIVGKAVAMADLMHIPVLGLVENFSYIRCPDCGSVIEPFGKSRIEEVAAEFHINNTARLPIDPNISRASDAGMIELFEGDWLNGLSDVIDSAEPLAR